MSRGLCFGSALSFAIYSSLGATCLPSLDDGDEGTDAGPSELDAGVAGVDGGAHDAGVSRHATLSLEGESGEGPLSPELARPCLATGNRAGPSSRLFFFALTNDDDSGPLSIDAIGVMGDDGFSALPECLLVVGNNAESQDCANVSLERGPRLQITVCFSSDMPGAHAAELRVETSAGLLTATASASVRANGSALDPAFGGSGAIEDPAAFFLGGGLALAPLGAGALVGQRIVDAAGVFADDVVPFHTILFAESFGGGDAFVINNLNGSCALARVHAGGLLVAFGNAGEVDLSSNACPHRALAVHDDAVFVSGLEVFAFTLDGAPLMSFGTSGRLVDAPTAHWLAIDDVFLYAGDRDSGTTRRYDRTGASDSAFVLPAAGPMAMDSASGALFIADAASATLYRFDGDTETASAATPVLDLAVDESGRVVVADGTSALRFSSDLATVEPVALADVAATLVACPESGGCFVGYPDAVARLLP